MGMRLLRPKLQSFPVHPMLVLPKQPKIPVLHPMSAPGTGSQRALIRNNIFSMSADGPSYWGRDGNHWMTLYRDAAPGKYRTTYVILYACMQSSAEQRIFIRLEGFGSGTE